MKLCTLLLFVLFAVKSFAEAIKDDCGCPQVKCYNPCEEQTGITFYTEKCASGKKVKSCAKPTCTALEEPNAACLAFQKQNNSQRTIASSPENETAKHVFEPVNPTVGKVAVLKGSAWLKNESGQQTDLKLGANLKESDLVITSSTGRVKIKLNDGNFVHVLPNSILKMTEVNFAEKKTLIDLYKGKIRSKVNNKLKDSQSYFRVRTKSAVAGVRGTDFVVSYEVNQKSITKVQTLEGSVDLSSGDLKQKQAILGGQEASFVVAANTSEVFSDDEIDDFIARGYMTPVYKMSEAEVKSLNWDTDAENKPQMHRALAAANSKYICSQPQAQLNQCSWKCENNPKGEKRCRTDLPHVNCVRKLCNANGVWADESRLPATFFDKCDPQKVKVGP
ncbi:MAG: FecR domain-containing protein, partial [Bdellovibrionales bacterium]|nr:FecR domain-containing protein [Bdellovibrionales bacterium]